MPNPEDYTVGWICAVKPELVAAQAFLDEKHNDPDHIPINDNNAYVLGRIGKHNVVIAALPQRQYGLVSAASVARDMVRSFPNIRIGLMVGVGGGAPSSKHDIRLGDVVVSSPGRGNGGVFQYDYGRTVQDRSFTTTGTLNQPPQFLLTAMSVLEAQHESEGHNIEQTINSILDRKPRLRANYQRPDSSTDILYKSSVEHAGTENDSCADVCNNVANLVSRIDRSQRQDDPAIHYGQIASANQLMKDALIRDRLSAEKDILCFEMEAAGLMNHFPCLVIRGICDYSDSHKNSLWQGYAAMTAVAYAKGLLAKVAPNKVEAEKKLGEFFLGVNTRLDDIHTTVRNLRADGQFHKIRQWLSPSDPSTNLNKALDQRQQGSGQWLLQSKAYSTWKTERNSFLWLHGIPGCGKTILSAIVIEDLEKRHPISQAPLYFFFDFTDSHKQSLEDAVRSLVFQLYCKNELTRSYLDGLFSSTTYGDSQPIVDLLYTIFHTMAEVAGEVWIVLDALDECYIRDKPQGGLLSWIEHLRGLEMNIHLLVTSRPEQDIKSTIERCAQIQDIIIIESDLVWEDIRAYIRARVEEHRGLQRWHSRPKIQNEIEVALIEKANGMFRWVTCQLDDLERCLDYPSVRKALSSLPTTLDETYARILQHIPEDYKHRTIRILQFLAFSERPLLVDEAVDAIAVDMEKIPRFNPEDRMPDPEEITKYCSSLVTKDDYTKMLQLAHYSVKEFLISNRPENGIARHLEETAARGSIAEVCLAYLLSLDHSLSSAEMYRFYPMLSYSVNYWTGHATVAEKSNEMVCILEVEFFTNSETYEVWIQLVGGLGLGPDELQPALCFAASRGLIVATRMLLEQGVDVNIQVGDCLTALQAASLGGHLRIVQMLLKKGANIEANYGLYGTALMIASLKGHLRIVQMLLEKGANVNAYSEYSATALVFASLNGHLRIVQILLEKGANVNADHGVHGTALMAASSNGHLRIVRVLLKNGADVNAQAGGCQARFCGTAIEEAFACGHQRIALTLLKGGANAETWMIHRVQKVT